MDLKVKVKRNKNVEKEKEGEKEEIIIENGPLIRVTKHLTICQES